MVWAYKIFEKSERTRVGKKLEYHVFAVAFGDVMTMMMVMIMTIGDDFL